MDEISSNLRWINRDEQTEISISRQSPPIINRQWLTVNWSKIELKNR